MMHSVKKLLQLRGKIEIMSFGVAGGRMTKVLNISFKRSLFPLAVIGAIASQGCGVKANSPTSSNQTQTTNTKATAANTITLNSGIISVALTPSQLTQFFGTLDTNDAVTFTLNTAPSPGVMIKGTTIMVAGGTFTSADLAAGSVVFQSNGLSTSDSVVVSGVDSKNNSLNNVKISVAISPFCSGSALTASPFAGGSGTSGSPYLICTPTQFDHVRANLTSYFSLMADLDMTGFQSSVAYADAVAAQNLADFWPLGDTGLGGEAYGPADTNHVFTGSFNGKGHVVRNIKITQTTDDGDVGVFGVVGWSSGPGIVSNLGIESALITSQSETGGFAGGVRGTVQDSYFQGTINATGAQSEGFGGFTSRVIVGGTIQRVYTVPSFQSTASWEAFSGLVNSDDSDCQFGSSGFCSVLNAFAVPFFSASVLATAQGRPIFGNAGTYYTTTNDTWDIYQTTQNSGTQLSTDPDGRSTGVDSSNTQSGYFYNPSNAPLNSWDFSNVWAASTSTYPKLRIQN